MIGGSGGGGGGGDSGEGGEGGLGGGSGGAGGGNGTGLLCVHRAQFSANVCPSGGVSHGVGSPLDLKGGMKSIVTSLLTIRTAALQKFPVTALAKSIVPWYEGLDLSANVATDVGKEVWATSSNQVAYWTMPTAIVATISLSAVMTPPILITSMELIALGSCVLGLRLYAP